MPHHVSGSVPLLSVVQVSALDDVPEFFYPLPVPFSPPSVTLSQFFRGYAYSLMLGRPAPLSLRVCSLRVR